MATPRKHWFKVPDSIGDEDWDNDVLAALIRLQARLNTKWARNGLVGAEAGRITLSAGDAMAVTHRTSFARASSLLRRCTAAVSLTVRVERASVKIEWPKWPEFQGLIARESPESRPLRKTPPQDARRKTQEEPEAPSAPPAARAPRSPAVKVNGKTACPEKLEPEARDRILSWAKVNRISPEQVAYAWQRVKDWASANGKLKHSWEATLRNGIREGWALEGYGARSDGKPAGQAYQEWRGYDA